MPDRARSAAACCPAAPSASPRRRRPRPAADRPRCWPQRARQSGSCGQSSTAIGQRPRRQNARPTCSAKTASSSGSALTSASMGPMALPRALCALAALSGLVLACSPAVEKPAASPAPAPPETPPAAPPPPRTTPSAAAPNTPLDSPVPAATAPPACGDGSALLAGMSTRDKLAQLLLVGVRHGADARAVVADYHIGGVMVGSWTDLSMLSDGSLADIAGSAGPLPLAVTVDEEGGRGSRLGSLLGNPPAGRGVAETPP